MSGINPLTGRCIIRRAGIVGMAVCVVIASAGFGAAAAETAANEPMKMNEPMAGKMKKEGMKKDDVMQSEKKWERKMKGMMEQEDQAEVRGNPKK